MPPPAQSSCRKTTFLLTLGLSAHLGVWHWPRGSLRHKSHHVLAGHPVQGNGEFCSEKGNSVYLSCALLRGRKQLPSGNSERVAMAVSAPGGGGKLEPSHRHTLGLSHCSQQACVPAPSRCPCSSSRVPPSRAEDPRHSYVIACGRITFHGGSLP